jgi:hypothetical protein
MLTQVQFGEWQSIFITGDGANTKFPWKCRGDFRAARDILANMNVKKAVVDRLLADFESVGGHCDCTIVVNVPFDALEECSDG